FPLWRQQLQGSALTLRRMLGNALSISQKPSSKSFFKRNAFLTFDFNAQNRPPTFTCMAENSGKEINNPHILCSAPLRCTAQAAVASANRKVGIALHDSASGAAARRRVI